MTLETYVKRLASLMEKQPLTKDFMVITASDDEGNSYTPIFFDPSVGLYKNNDYEQEHGNPNAVCVN